MPTAKSPSLARSVVLEAASSDVEGTAAASSVSRRRVTAHDVLAQMPIRSDDLADLRDVFALFPTLAKHVGAPEETRLVLDANAVIADIRWLVKKRKSPKGRTALQEAIASKTLVAFAPSFLDDEIRLNLAKVSEYEGIPLGPMLDAWREYRASIRFYEAERPTTLVAPSGAVDPDAPVDPKDVPYVETYLAVGAAAILTNDPHLTRMGARTVRFELGIAMRDYARAASIELTLKWRGLVVLTLAVGCVQQLARCVVTVARAIQRAPKAIQVGLAFGVLAALLHRPTRARIANALSAGWTGAETVLTEVLPLLAELMTIAREEGERARTSWSALAPYVQPRRLPLRVHAFAICAASERTISTSEIIRELTRRGVRTSSPSFARYLRSVLRRHPAVHEVAANQWLVVSAA